LTRAVKQFGERAIRRGAVDDDKRRRADQVIARGLANRLINKRGLECWLA
jgi:hypothetical protein